MNPRGSFYWGRTPWGRERLLRKLTTPKIPAYGSTTYGPEQ